MKHLDLSLESFNVACILYNTNIFLSRKVTRFGAEINDKEGLMKTILHLGNALVDMHAKCGANLRKNFISFHRLH